MHRGVYVGREDFPTSPPINAIIHQYCTFNAYIWKVPHSLGDFTHKCRFPYIWDAYSEGLHMAMYGTDYWIVGW